MKILLAYQSGELNRHDPYISLVPTGLCYLHACLLEAGHESILANFSGWSKKRVEKELLKIEPEMVGISQWTHNRHVSLELAGVCRQLFPGCLIVMGGGHATFCYDDVLADGSPVDIVVRGEGERTLLELAERVALRSDWLDVHGLAFRHNGSVVATTPRALLDNLDELPQPARYLENSIGVDQALQPEFIVTARGCPSACHFCSSPTFWGKKVRFRSPRAIVDEILYIRQKYGLIYFSIRDDTFTADRKRTIEFCHMLIERRVDILWNCQSRVTAIDVELLQAMKMAGCECIQLGVESGSPRILSFLGKNTAPAQIIRAGRLIRDVGINLSIYLISDIPGETADDIKDTITLVRSLQPDDGYVSPLAYYPGTLLLKDAVVSGKTDVGLFQEKRSSALYAKKDQGGGAELFLKEISRSRQEDPSRFKSQKERLGYCFTTNVIAGEWYRLNGDYRGAEVEFSEMTVEQPENPWGWFLLAELYAEMGRNKRATECYKAVLKMVPQHAPSIAALST